jgi:hypothetical protein
LINFKPFQTLYQQVKKTDSKLFEAFGTISSYLQSLGTASDNLSTLAQTPNFVTASTDNSAAFSVVQTFTNAFVLASGLTVTLPKAGKWFITLSLGIKQQSPDATLQARLLVSGMIFSGGIVVDNGGSGILGIAYMSATNTWNFQAHGGEVVTVQIAKGGGAGTSGILNNCTLSAIWTNP